MSKSFNFFVFVLLKREDFNISRCLHDNDSKTIRILPTGLSGGRGEGGVHPIELFHSRRLVL